MEEFPEVNETWVRLGLPGGAPRIEHGQSIDIECRGAQGRSAHPAWHVARFVHTTREHEGQSTSFWMVDAVSRSVSQRISYEIEVEVSSGTAQPSKGKRRLLCSHPGCGINLQLRMEKLKPHLDAWLAAGNPAPIDLDALQRYFTSSR